MQNRTQHPAGPDGLDTVSLIELVSALEGHLGDLERARVGTGPRYTARIQNSALHAVAIITVMMARLTRRSWPAVQAAVEHGATIAAVAAAMGEDDAHLVADRFRGWIEHARHHGVITAGQRAALVALAGTSP